MDFMFRIRRMWRHRSASALAKKGIYMLRKIVIKAVIIVALLLVICEYFIYPLVLVQCSWPNPRNSEKESGSRNSTLQAMFLADTHLLGPFRGHWFDKLRREWQMHRAFQTAMFLFQPEAVFFLGDLFDEGNWVNGEGFSDYVNRFHDLFSVKGNKKTRSFMLTGNHDMGFHYEIIPYLHRRFNKAFNTTSVRLVKLKGSNFLLLNSMAMEMDGCFLCSAAKKSLHKISETLKCEENPETCESPVEIANAGQSVQFSSPILLQHFPMYRKSDEACTGEDAAPKEEKYTNFRETFDCLSNESSQLLFKLVRPRLILSGHTHHHCVTKHNLPESSQKTTIEYSVPSFSWRNRNDPSFYLASITPVDYHLVKCYLPRESSVYLIYASGGIFLVIWVTIPSYLLRGAVCWLRSTVGLFFSLGERRME